MEPVTVTVMAMVMVTTTYSNGYHEDDKPKNIFGKIMEIIA